MNTFFRYFIHFNIVSLAILTLVGTIGVFGKLSLDFRIIATVIIGVFIFSLGMSIVHSTSIAYQEQAILSFKTEEEKINKLLEIEKVVTGKLKKVEINHNSNQYVFSEKMKYSRWLTNPIRIEIEGNTIKVVTPRVYLHLIT